MSARVGKLVVDNNIELNILSLTYGLHPDGTLILTGVVDDDPTTVMLAFQPYTIAGNGVVPKINSLVAYDDNNEVIFSDTTHHFVFSSAKVDLFAQFTLDDFANKLSVSFTVDN